MAGSLPSPTPPPDSVSVSAKLRARQPTDAGGYGGGVSCKVILCSLFCALFSVLSFLITRVVGCLNVQAEPFFCLNSKLCAFDQPRSAFLCCPPPCLSQPCPKYTPWHEPGAISISCDSDYLADAENLFRYLLHRMTLKDGDFKAPFSILNLALPIVSRDSRTVGARPLQNVTAVTPLEFLARPCRTGRRLNFKRAF